MLCELLSVVDGGTGGVLKVFNIKNGFGIIHAAMFYSRCYFAFPLLILDSKFRPRGDFFARLRLSLLLVVESRKSVSGT